MRSYIDFVNYKNSLNAINEALGKDFDNYVDKINELLSKHITKLVPLVGYSTTISKDKEYISKQYLVYKKGHTQLFQINWLKSSKSKEPYSIDFFKDSSLLFNTKAKSALTINTLGSSIVYFLPIIWTVVNNDKYDISSNDAIKLGRSIFTNKETNESFYIGAQKYVIVNETEAEDYAATKQNELLDAMKKRHNSDTDYERFNRISKEFDAIVKAINGGAKTIEDIKLSLEKNSNISLKIDKLEADQEKKVKDEGEDPVIAFKKMDGYVKMVIKGVNPSLILCGAPGVGKTYRVKKLLKENGFKEEDNLFTIKGKCTPRVLYLALYKYKEKGKIIVIDDADGLVGPKAPEDCINILKGALDSTSDDEGRLVSYGISGKITDDNGNELPKRFYYNGNIIIITNYNAGSLDTALRGRSYIQDIHFSVDNVLKIIKDLMPNLSSDRLGIVSKQKAYDYLIKLNAEDADMEVSIRTFIICATLFESLKDEDDDLVKEMIKEQMKLQADRRKNKY